MSRRERIAEGIARLEAAHPSLTASRLPGDRVRIVSRDGGPSTVLLGASAAEASTWYAAARRILDA